jgi:hypothetical protein
MRGRMADMRFRKLRFAWSVVWGLAAVLLIALWVRSYRWEDVITAPGDGSRRFGSAEGWITIRWTEPRWKEMRRPPNLNFKKWQVVSLSVEEREQKLARTHVKSRPPQFGFVDAGAVQFPYWLATMVCVGMSAALWIRWRFSLRTLLIATTLVAVVLGLIVWLR